MTPTKRQLEALRIMRDEDEELVYERGECRVGDEKFSARTFFSLLRVMAISHCSLSAKQGSGGLEVYTLNGTGREYLAAIKKAEESNHG